jgi:EAL domain-containing protein (putative c-di-GMP-specific phosphodiesterase class I)
VHALTIDRSFIQGMVGSAHSRTIVDTIISLAHSLGVKVTAEGVETEEQAKCSRRYAATSCRVTCTVDRSAPTI